MKKLLFNINNILKDRDNNISLSFHIEVDSTIDIKKIQNIYESIIYKRLNKKSHNVTINNIDDLLKDKIEDIKDILTEDSKDYDIKIISLKIERI